ncbi:MAG: DUF5717 family protein [Clostridiales bacterium]|nr:DUF5717 family protein [Clostridiales bacterium]
MKERINQLAQGNMAAELPKVEFLQPQIEEIIPYGENYRGDIRVVSGNQLAFRGLIYSDDSRVVPLQSMYVGVSVFLPYEVQADQLPEGTVLQGCFYLVYNGGECQLPYRFEVKRWKEERPELETLEELTEYVKENPAQAQKLFESRDFSSYPFMEDLAVRAIYDGLNRAVYRNNMPEEFLCSVGMKERVVLETEDLERTHFLPETELTDKIVLRRNTWGQFVYQAETDNPAVELSCSRITDQDFEGDTFELYYTIRKEQLHGGRNYGRIRIHSALQTISLELTMSAQEQPGHAGRKHRERRGAVLEFWNTFLRLFASREQKREQLDYLKYCWEEMTKETEPTTWQNLQRIAIGIWQGDIELAKAMLEEVGPLVEENRREDADAYCAYLYLQVQITDSWEKKEQMLKILNHYEMDGNVSEFLFLMMLTTDEGLADRPLEMLERMHEYYEKGSRNPFLYLEACRIYNRHPDILKNLEEFELHALLFGARRKVLSEETAVYVASLSSQERGYRPEFGRILKILYHSFEKDEILGGLCSVLIKGDQRGTLCFPWYAKGVERDIRLTRLYDYYLYTVPEEMNEPFPREIVLYFSYNSPRDPESQETLYLNIFRFMENDSHVMTAYENQFRDFVARRLQEGRINDKIAEIYRHILSPEAVDERNARLLPDLLCTWKITTEESCFTEAVVVYGELEEERIVPMKNGVAYLPIYTDLCRILFVDRDGKRYAGVKYEKKRLLEYAEDMLAKCYEICPRHLMLRLAECSRILVQGCRREEQILLLKKMLEVRNIHRQYRKKLMKSIAEGVIHQRDPHEEDVRECVRYGGISSDQKNRLIQILIEQGQLKEAYRQIRCDNYRDLPLESLRKLISLIIQNSRFDKNEALLEMSYYLFENETYDEVILEYLCAYYNSSSDRMLAVLVKADEAKVPFSGMEERLLAQMLFAGQGRGLDVVFRLYLKQGTGERMLIHAYLAVRCEEYFRYGQAVDEEVFQYVRHLLNRAEERKKVPRICMLALARHYAEKSELDKEEEEYCSRLVNELYRQGLAFAWMKQLSGKVKLPQVLEEREWLEYQGDPDQDLELRMTIFSEKGGKTEIRTWMPQVYPGFYVKSVLLFEGENLNYEIVCEKNGTKEILARVSCCGKASQEEDTCQYAELNRLQKIIQASDSVQQWQQDVLEYGMKETWVEQIFQME